MDKLKPIFLTLALVLGLAAASSNFAQSTATTRLAPNALVADLYKVHKQKHSPFFQTRSRALLYKYFEKTLADMIWKDAVHSKREVGAIDGDPLYDAQDMDIKKFEIQKPVQENGKAKVNVTFENFGEKKTIVFTLSNGTAGWRISDIGYGEGRTLMSELKETYK
jgi:Protein of unknown function (DUF3828)